MGATTESYTYDGGDVRVGKTVGGVTTDYLWDRPANGSPRTGCSCNREQGAPLPLLVDDGTTAYLHADGLLAEIDAANAATYPLADALGSVRGLTDGTGAVAGTADYDVFGAIRSQSGVTSEFGFTGERRDEVTGFTYLRARYLNPVLGRFVTQDTVQPNAPGAQGYTRYTYTANNPTTWTDPSGHTIDDAMQQFKAIDLIIGAMVTLGSLVITLIPAMLAMPMLQLALGIFFFVAFFTLAMLLLKVIGDVLMLLQDAFDHYSEGVPTSDPPQDSENDCPSGDYTICGVPDPAVDPLTLLADAIALIIVLTSAGIVLMSCLGGAMAAGVGILLGCWFGILETAPLTLGLVWAANAVSAASIVAACGPEPTSGNCRSSVWLWLKGKYGVPGPFFSFAWDLYVWCHDAGYSSLHDCVAKKK